MKKPKKANAKKQVKSRVPQAPVRSQYLSLRGWAIGTLLETHAIVECPDHGHIRDRGSWAHGWDDARAIAKSDPFSQANAEQCVAAIDEVMAAVGDVCPEC